MLFQHLLTYSIGDEFKHGEHPTEDTNPTLDFKITDPDTAKTPLESPTNPSVKNSVPYSSALAENDVSDSKPVYDDDDDSKRILTTFGTRLANDSKDNCLHIVFDMEYQRFKQIRVTAIGNLVYTLGMDLRVCDEDPQTSDTLHTVCQYDRPVIERAENTSETDLLLRSRRFLPLGWLAENRNSVEYWTKYLVCLDVSHKPRSLWLILEYTDTDRASEYTVTDGASDGKWHRRLTGLSLYHDWSPAVAAKVDTIVTRLSNHDEGIFDVALICENVDTWNAESGLDMSDDQEMLVRDSLSQRQAVLKRTSSPNSSFPCIHRRCIDTAYAHIQAMFPDSLIAIDSRLAYDYIISPRALFSFIHKSSMLSSLSHHCNCWEKKTRFAHLESRAKSSRWIDRVAKREEKSIGEEKLGQVNS